MEASRRRKRSVSVEPRPIPSLTITPTPHKDPSYTSNSSQHPSSPRIKSLNPQPFEKLRRWIRESSISSQTEPLPSEPTILSPPSTYITPPLPLTVENLRLLRGEMDPLTPDKSRSGEKTSDDSSSSKVLELRHILAINNMSIEETRVKKENAYKDIMEFAGGIILHKERHSKDNPGSAEKLGQIRDKYATRNEDSFMKKYWGKLIRDEREVEITEEPVENTRERHYKKATDLVKTAWEKQAWDVHNLDDNWNREFFKDSIPAIDTKDDPVATRILAAHDRIKNPKPDVCYGLDEGAFTEAELKVNRLYNKYAGISNGIWHPGAIVEAKTAGIIELVECQCARGGAALVSAMRELLVRAGADVSTPGADTKSAVFSVVLVPTCATIHVHWAQVRDDDDLIYHMHLVDSYAIRKDSQSLLLRNKVNNILDWITLTRKTWIKQILADIGARDQAGLPSQLTIGGQHLNERTRQPNNGARCEAMNTTTSDHGIGVTSGYDMGTAADQGEEDLEDEAIQRKGKKRKL